nr:hypothetical protein [uncultured Rhizobium sp.]
MISQGECAMEGLRSFGNGSPAAADGHGVIDTETCPVTMLERHPDEIADRQLIAR